MTHEEFGAQLENLLDLERWNEMPAACAQLRPQPLSWDEERMELIMAFDTTDWMGNPLRWLHGGIMATIFDNAMGSLATVCSQGRFTPTVSMNVNFLRPAPLVGRLYVKGRVVKAGRSLIHTTAELAGDTDFLKPYASAVGVYAIHSEARL